MNILRAADGLKYYDHVEGKVAIAEKGSPVLVPVATWERLKAGVQDFRRKWQCQYSAQAALKPTATTYMITEGM